MKITIIGSGVSGLTAAAYLSGEGHEVTVYEQNTDVGGVTSGLQREGFHWDMGQRILEGFAHGEQVGTIIDELGIRDRLQMNRQDRVYVFPDFRMEKPEEYGGPWWRKEQLQNLFPEDRKGLERYYRYYVRFMELITMARRAERSVGIMSIWYKLRLFMKLVPFIPKIKWNADRMMKHFFSSQKLQAAFISILADFTVRPSQFPGLGVAAVNPEPAFDRRVPLKVSLSGSQPSYQFIEGGCRSLVDALVTLIKENGATIRTGITVESIDIVDKRVQGVVLSDGSRQTADIVMASGGAKETFFNIAGREHFPADFVKSIETVPLMESIFMVHIGIDFDPTPWQKSGVTYYYRTYDIEKGVDDIMRGHYHQGEDGLLICIPSLYSEGMSPEGTHAVTVYTIAPDTLQEGSWEDRKEAYADRLLEIAEEYVPGLREHTLVLEVLTPDDFKRITHLQHHAFGGCAPVMGRKGAPHQTPVDGLYFMGAQSESGAGINNVMEGAWRAVRLVRKYAATP